jgi:hypothetical protein
MVSTGSRVGLTFMIKSQMTDMSESEMRNAQVDTNLILV